MRPGTQITLSLAFVSIMWCGIGIMIGFDLYGGERPSFSAKACDQLYGPVKDDRPLVTHPSILNPAPIPPGSPLLPQRLQSITQGVMAVGVSPRGNAKPLQTDEDGYAICSPERKP